MVVVRPETIGILLLAALFLTHRGAFEQVRFALRVDRGLLVTVLLACAFVVWSATCAVVQGAFAGYWVRNLLVGWILPMLLALLVLGLRPQGSLRFAWRGLGIGVVLLLTLAFVLYFVSFPPPNSIEDVLANRYSRARAGIAGGVYFGRLTLGDFNAVPVFFSAVIAFLFGFSLDGRRRSVSPRVFLLCLLVAALAMLYLCYSRGAILSVVLVGGFALCLAAMFPVPRVRDVAPASLFVFLFFAALFLDPAAQSHWFSQLEFTRGSTAEFRLELWQGVVEGRSTKEMYRQHGPSEDIQNADTALVEAMTGRGATFGSPGENRLARPEQTAEQIRREVETRVGSRARRLLFGLGLETTATSRHDV